MIGDILYAYLSLIITRKGKIIQVSLNLDYALHDLCVPPTECPPPAFTTNKRLF